MATNNFVIETESMKVNVTQIASLHNPRLRATNRKYIARKVGITIKRLPLRVYVSEY